MRMSEDTPRKRKRGRPFGTRAERQALREAAIAEGVRARAEKEAAEARERVIRNRQQPFSNPAPSDGQWRQGSDGLMECVSKITGEILERQVPPKNARLVAGKYKGANSRESPDNPFHKLQDSAGFVHLVPKGTKMGAFPRMIWPYDVVMTERICDLVREGRSLGTIAKMEGMPPANVIFRWKEQHPDFDAQLRIAAKSRAWWMMEALVDQIDEVHNLHKDAVPAERLKYDLRKVIAEKFSPEEFGPRLKHDGNVGISGPLVIITGIHREGDKPPVKDVESTATPAPELVDDEGESK